MAEERFKPAHPRTLLQETADALVMALGREPTLEELQAANPYREIALIVQADIQAAIAAAPSSLQRFLEAELVD